MREIATQRKEEMLISGIKTRQMSLKSEERPNSKGDKTKEYKNLNNDPRKLSISLTKDLDSKKERKNRALNLER